LSAGYSPIPSPTLLHELEDDERRDSFVADHVRVRLALLIRSLREQNGWSQADLGRRLGKPQSVISRLENPDYGRVSLQTLFEVATAFKLPVYIDLPNWDEWFRLMEDISSRNLQRRGFDAQLLASLATSPLQPDEQPSVSVIDVALTQKQSPVVRPTTIVPGQYRIDLGLIVPGPLEVSSGQDEPGHQLIDLMKPLIPAPQLGPMPWSQPRP
jgi:transcriptional regulator with XRE-family HTH domain